MPVTDDVDLDEVLHNKVLLDSFQKYNVEKMHDPNPVPFMQALEKFKQAAMDPKVGVEQLSEMAKQLATQYVKPDDYVAPKSMGIDDGEGDDFLNIQGAEARQTNANVAKLGQIARGELPMPSREELAETFAQAEKTVRLNLSTKGNNLESWKKSPAFKQAQDDIQQLEDKITQLEKQAEKLQGSRWERFKAAVFGGGVDKQMAKIAGEIEKAKMDMLLKTDPERFETIQNEKRKMAEKMGTKQKKLIPDDDAMQLSKSAAVVLAVDSGPLGSNSLSKDDQAKLGKLAGKGIASEKLGQQKQELEKSVKVGEALKGQLGSKQSQGAGKQRVK